MPDNTVNFSVDTTNAPVSATTTTRDNFINILEHLNYAAGYIRSIDNLYSSPASGVLCLTSDGAANLRALTGANGLTVNNGDGEADAPSIGIGTPSTVRQALADIESDTITEGKRVTIIATSGSYALPAPTASVIHEKYIINKSSGNATITSTAWADSAITTSVVIPTKGMAIFVSDEAQKWYVQVSGNLTIS